MKFIRYLQESIDYAAMEDELDDSIEGYLSQAAEEGREAWVYNNKYSGLKRYAKEAMEDEAYMVDVVQGNMKRWGFPSVFTVYKGHLKGEEVFSSKDKFFNATTRKEVAQNYYRALGLDKKFWEVTEINVKLTDVIGFGHPPEAELIIKRR